MLGQLTPTGQRTFPYIQHSATRSWSPVKTGTEKGKLLPFKVAPAWRMAALRVGGGELFPLLHFCLFPSPNKLFLSQTMCFPIPVFLLFFPSPAGDGRMSVCVAAGQAQPTTFSRNVMSVVRYGEL